MQVAIDLAHAPLSDHPWSASICPTSNQQNMSGNGMRAHSGVADRLLDELHARGEPEFGVDVRGGAVSKRMIAISTVSVPVPSAGP